MPDKKRTRLATIIVVMLAFILPQTLPQAAQAQEIISAGDTVRFIFDTGVLLAGGLAALMMITGFCMRDAGMARIANAPAVCLRMAGLFALTALMMWLVGYNLIFSVEKGGLLGGFSLWRAADIDPVTAGAASGARWLLHTGYAAVAAAIVAGAVAERVKLWPFLLFIAGFSALIYPLAASWSWGGGYLADSWRFYDHGGAVVVHGAGGAAALAAALIIGPRAGRYFQGGMRAIAPQTLLLAALGGGLILPAWLVLNAASLGAASSVEDLISIGTISVNTVVAGASGMFAALALTQIIYKRASLGVAISAMIGGLVAITADPLHPMVWQAAMIGAVGGVIVTVAPPFLDRYRIDDPASVISAHLLCSFWAALIVPWTNGDVGLIGQAVGVGAITGFAFVMSALLWMALKYTTGVRLPAAETTPAGERGDERSDERAGATA